MQTQFIRSRRNDTRWITTAFAIFIPSFLILFLQHGVTKAQSEDPTATSTETSAYAGTDTDTPTYLDTSTGTPTETLFPLVSPTDTDTETETATPTETPESTATQTATDGFVTGHITNQIILRYKSGSQAASSPRREDQMLRLNNAAGVSMEYRRAMSGGALVFHFPGRHSSSDIQAIANKLKKLPEVEYAEPDWVLYPTAERAETLPVLESRPLFFVPNDPYYVYQWHYFETYGINAEAAWDMTTGSTSVTVAVIDTGITSHAEFAGRIVPGYDFIDDELVANDGDGRDSDPSDPGDWITQEESDDEAGWFYGCPVGDSSWHGTHTAGTIGASGNNNLGVAGIDWQAKILPVRVLGKCGGYTSDIVDGMRWAAGLTVTGVPANANPAKVLSISLGGYHACGTTTQTAINEIIAAGGVVVVAAGNSNMDASGFGPGNCNGVITVAATERYGQKAYYSNYGTTVEISAPGGDVTAGGGYDGVLSTLNMGTQGPESDTYAFYQGTSMAAPHVSGVVSLLYSIDPTLTPAEVLTILQSTVTAFPAGGSCTTANCGSGIVNAGAAVASLLPTPTPTDTATGTLLTPTETPTATPTLTPTITPTRTPTRTMTNTPPASIVVLNNADSGPGSLRQAVADISSGGVITFDPSLAGQTIILASTINLARNVTIDGSSLSARVEISGNDSIRIFLLNNSSQVTLKSLVLKNGKMTGSSYLDFGGAMYIDMDCQVTIQDTLLIDNSAYEAGAINVRPDVQLTILNSEFTSNTAQANAGAIRSYYATVTIRNSVFTDNIAAAGGGAIYLQLVGTYVIEDNTFTGNQAQSGGAVYVEQGPVLDAALRRNLFTGNTATKGGALLYTYSTSPRTLVVENNTFYANQAGEGGAIYASGIAVLRNNTLSGNIVTTAGASILFNATSSNTLYNNIIANGSGSAECVGYGSYSVAGNNNLVEDGSAICMPSVTGDPLLGPLTDNGGPTLTMALPVDSPAVDAGDDANCPSTDARGVGRPQGSHCDIGAFEFVLIEPTDTPTPTITVSLTPTVSDTPTETAMPSETETPTATPSPTETETPTTTPSSTETPTPTETATETPESPTPTPVLETVFVVVLDTDGNPPEAGTNVTAYTGGSFSGYEGFTDSEGLAAVEVPPGTYQFRVVKGGTAFYSAECVVPGCISTDITINVPVTITVLNLDGQPEAGISVMAFNGATYTGYSGYTNAQGQVSFTMPDGSYRFRAYKNNRFFWSGGSNHCAIPGCRTAAITVDNTVIVTVLDSGGNPESGLNVLVYNGSTYAGYAAYTNAQGQASLALPAGSYRFRVAKNGTAFWSGTSNHCTVPGCASASITTTIPVVVTVLNLEAQPESGLIVQVYNGSTYAGYTATTNVQGQVNYTLPVGSYRFRVYKNSRSFWSGPANHCSVPGCTSAGITVDNTVTVTVLDSVGNPEIGLNVQAYNGSTFAGYSLYTNAQGQAAMALPAGDYRFRVVKGGTAFWSGPANHCTVPGCSSASITISLMVTITVLNLDGQPEAGIPVMAFTGSTYTGYSGTTNAQGQLSFTMPDGAYHFRAYKNNRFFWSGADNHCTVPGCANATITVDNTVVVTVLDTDGNPEAGLNVLAYNGSTYAGFAAYTNAQGQASLALPAGSYRFRVAKGGTAFWSGTSNHCTIPGCASASITTTIPVVVTVLDASSQPEPGLTVQAYNNSTYAGYSAVTNAQGQVSFTLPVGNYRFRTIKASSIYWSGLANHCTVPGCTSTTITTGTTLVTVTVTHDPDGPIPDLVVEVFSEMFGESVAPLDVQGLTSGVADISVGWEHACALTTQGGVKCWGLNMHGEVGDGTNIRRYTPVDVVGLTSGVVAISTGFSHTCAVLSTGGVKCWGSNSYGELGDGTNTESDIPVDVVGLTGSISEVALGGSHTCALSSTGAVKCWGHNNAGQLGDGTNQSSYNPVDVVGLSSGVTGIAAAEEYTCAVAGGGAAKCWGFNLDGELGNGSDQNSNLPVDVIGLSSGVLSIDTKWFHSCAVTGTGVKCWGGNWAGQLGDGSTSGSRTPVDVNGLGSGINVITVSASNTCVVMQGGGAKCWGDNQMSQVVDGPNLFEPFPVDMPRLVGNVTDIDSANGTICAIVNGGIQCWGWNGDNQLGYGPIYLNMSTVTNAQGQVTFNLPPGAYTFRVEVDIYGHIQDFLSFCTTPGCTNVVIEI